MKVMSVRDFLRGGYKTLKEPTLISRHGIPMFTVFPPINTKKEARFAALADPIMSDRLAAGHWETRDELPQEVSAQGAGQQVRDVPGREDDGELP